MRKIDLPRTSERIRGVSLPDDGIMYVCDYDEVFKIVLGDTLKVTVLDDEPYEFLSSLTCSIGVESIDELLEFNGNMISYNFIPTQSSVSVECQVGENCNIINFPILSGDWFGASFSICGRYIVLAEPYNFEVYSID